MHSREGQTFAGNPRPHELAHAIVFCGKEAQTFVKLFSHALGGAFSAEQAPFQGQILFRIEAHLIGDLGHM